MLDINFTVKHTLPMVENSLREIRLKKEIPQNVIAEAAEVSRQTIHAIETGKYIPSIEVCLKIAEFLKMPVETIFRINKKKR